MATGRNDPCPCGSGKRYKHCCGALGAQAVATPITTKVTTQAAAGAGVHTAAAPGDSLATLLAQGRAGDAEREARALLARDPRSGRSWKALGIALLHQGKDAGDALLQAADLLPDDVPLQVAAGNTLAQAGRAREAVPVYERALEREPRNAATHNNLGNALKDLGELARAADRYRAALELAPGDAEVECNLGNTLRQLGRAAEAVDCGRRAVARAGHLAFAHTTLGLALAALGQPAQAEASLRRAAELEPRSVPVLTHLAHVLRDQGRHEDALALYRRAAELDPGQADSHCHMGHAYYELGRLSEAVASFRRALALRAGLLPAYVGLATALRRQGCADEAEASCQAALAHEPSHVPALSLLADLHADRGEFDRAQELLHQALALDPRSPAVYCSIAASRRMTPADLPWRQGAEALLETGLPAALEAALCFALGKYHDDLAEFDAAFERYRRANELSRPRGAGYDRQEWTRTVDRMIAAFDARYMRTQHAGASDSEAPVLVIGMPRSGTTLAEQILASHPEVYGAGEVDFWASALGRFEAAGDPGRAEVIAALGREYLSRLSASAGAARRMVDKMPANFLYAGLIHVVFPRARILHMQRHPLDTCLSIYFQDLRDTRPYTHDLGDLAHYYGEYRRLADHWRAVLPPTTLLEVPYEGLVGDPELWIRRMLGFVGLPWDARCLDFHRAGRIVLTASRWQVRQRLNPGSIGRWRHYERHLAPLLPLLTP